MILGIGCDIVNVDRFVSWRSRSVDQLGRVYTEQELATYARTAKPLEFLASRFAAKEAFYKALCGAFAKLALPEDRLSFAFVRTCVGVENAPSGLPSLSVDWEAISDRIGEQFPVIQISFSLSHEMHYAVAFVVLDHSVAR